MPKNVATKRTNPATPLDRLRKALAKRTKAELVDVLAELADDDRKVLRQLEARFDLQSPVKELGAATRQAIADATDFDERRINYNFDYDYGAYEAVERNLKRLIETSALDAAMELALELMKSGSYQVEMSDEGLMTDDLEACLKPVIQGLKKSGLPAQVIVDWCDAMSRADRVGFICDKELRALRKRIAT